MAVSEAALAEPQWTLGDRMRKAREFADIEREEMASRLGVSVAAISHWERDRRRPMDVIEVIHRWSDETKVPVQWLLGLSPTTQSQSVSPFRLVLGGIPEQLRFRLKQTCAP